MTKEQRKPDADGWYANTGKRPATGDRKLYVRLRCSTRAHVETMQEPQAAKWWKRWRLLDDPGDIVEFKFA